MSSLGIWRRMAEIASIERTHDDGRQTQQRGVWQSDFDASDGSTIDFISQANFPR